MHYKIQKIQIYAKYYMASKKENSILNSAIAIGNRGAYKAIGGATCLLQLHSVCITQRV